MAAQLPPRYDYWWQAILALAPSREDVAYKRLERVFRDQTRPTKLDPATGRRGHEFTDPSHETHLTVTLWENFALFPASRWVPQVWAVAGLSTPLGAVRRCNWSYEWAEHGGVGAHHCDVVVEYEDAAGRGVLVVEAKKPGKPLTEKDLDPAYYLAIPQIAEFPRRSLVYLIDGGLRAASEVRVKVGGFDVGFLSWERLAAIQLDCVDSLAEASPAVRAFVAGSLYRQFAQNGIVPPVLPLGYLHGEPSADEVVSKRTGRPLGKGDWEREIWRLEPEGPG